MNARDCVVAAVCAIPALTGCATLSNGGHQSIAITSTPPGATVRSLSGQVCVTPGELKLKRDEDHVLTATLPGYPTQRQTLSRELGGAIFANLLFGGISGMAIDLASGSAHKLVPNRVHFDFREPAAAYRRPSSPSQADSSNLSFQEGTRLSERQYVSTTRRAP